LQPGQKGLLKAPEPDKVTAIQEHKCQEKEEERKEFLANMTPLPEADTDWIKLALQETSKPTDVVTLMQQVHNQYQSTVAKKTMKATVTKAKKPKKDTPKKAKQSQKTSRPPATVLQDISNTCRLAVGTTVHKCGCRHGDLSALKSFEKADAKFYLRPNKFLEGRSCLDCNQAVTNMKSNARTQPAVVYYCDEGIKGFDAPDNDPMKSALTCDLILCNKCEANRRIEYNKAEIGQQSSGNKRRRQRSRV
jgi:hypothetical protein